MLLVVGSLTAWGIYRLLTAPVAIEAVACSEVVPVARIPEPIAAEANLVQNSSMENLDAQGKPAAWSQIRVGDNTATFEVSPEAHSGQRSLKVAVTDFKDGSAMWGFRPVPVAPSTAYGWSAYYKSNVDTRVGADFTLDNGEHFYTQMANVPKSDDWRRVYYTIVPPLGAQTVYIYQHLAQTGTLELDDVTFGKFAGQRLSQGMVSLTFDDGLRETYEHGLPLLKKYGIVSTQYVVSEPIEHPAGKYYIDKSMLQEFEKLGHEIGSHTMTHADLTLLSPQQLENELVGSKTSIAQLAKVPITDFASPYGRTTPEIVERIDKTYCSHRNTFLGFNAPSVIDPLNIVSQNITNETTVAQLKYWVDFAREQKVWIVLVMHEVEQGGREYSIGPADLEEVLKHIKTTDTKTVTVADGLKLLREAQRRD